jgi:hypothetical protein
MIVNSLKDGWEIIYQRAHANLAAMILAGWKKSEDIYRRTETMIAVAQHDDQEMFWELSDHLTEQGAPLDFMQGTLDTTIEQVPMVIANAYRQGLWIALMISMHNSTLYEPQRGTSSALNRFLDEQAEHQTQWRKLLGVTKKRAEHTYSYMLFADTLSLILCRRQLPLQGRRLEVSVVGDQQTILVFEREDNTIGLDPWIFEENEVEFSLEMRHLQQLAFKSEAEFKTALDNAPLKLTIWRFKK